MRLIKKGPDTYGIYKIFEVAGDVTFNITAFGFDENPNPEKLWTGMICRDDSFDSDLTDSAKKHPQIQALVDWKTYDGATMLMFKEEHLTKVHLLLFQLVSST